MFLNLSGHFSYSVSSIDRILRDEWNNNNEAVTKDGDRFWLSNRAVSLLGAHAILPAEPGWRTLFLLDDGTFLENPVIAWAITASGCDPITLEGIDDDWDGLAPPNSDRVIQPHNQWWDSREEAARDLRAEKEALAKMAAENSQ